MKFLKLILISAFVFFFIVTGFSLLIPSHVTISRATNIAPGNDSILKYVCDLKEWENWHPQLENAEITDPSFSNGKIIAGKVNGIYLSVLKCDHQNATIVMQKGNTPIHNNWVLIKHGPSDSLTLRNFMEFDFAWYPWEKFSSLMLDGSYGPVMEAGLNKLSKK